MRLLQRNRKRPTWITSYVLPTGAALLFLLLWMKSQAVSLSEHNQYVGALRQLQEQDARINQSLLQLRLGLLKNYDPIVSKQAAIQALHTQLALPPRFIEPNYQQIQMQVQESQQLWREKNALIEQFNSRNSVLRNSLAYLPIAIENLSSDPAVAPETAARLNTVLKEVLLFNLSATQDNISEIQQEIEQLNKLSKSGDSDLAGDTSSDVTSDLASDLTSDTSSDIASAMAHANVILEKSLETSELIEQALRIPTRQQGRTLAETYDSGYQRAVRAANLYRFGLYLFLTALVVAIAASIISKLRAAAVSLRKATEDAQVANRAKSQFLSNMSHELRTPLNIILGFAQLMMRNGSLNPYQKDHIDSINQSGEHLLSLINDVLEMSKIEAGKVSLNPNDFDLHRLLEGIHTMFQFKAHSKGLQLSLQVADNVPQYVFADESKLRQVLVNLVGNAVKFTHVGCVCLRVRAGEWFVERENPAVVAERKLVALHFEVEDTGPGIPTDEIELLFDPFVQAKAQAAPSEGTGLGLPISRKFVEMMAGEISLSSQVGVGSQFVFSVKAGVVEGRDSFLEVRRTVVGIAANQPNYRILVAEDMPKSRQLLVELLSPLGFEVKEAANGLEALSICRSWQPDLIWMDLRMPTMDGYEATRQIKSEMGDLKPIVIALTGSAFASEQRRAIAAGCDDFVGKPFRTETIFAKMADYLNVKYVYSEPVADTIGVNRQTQSDKSLPITAADLQTMPSDWIRRVHRAATKVNGKEIASLLEEVPLEQEAIRLKLSQLVESYSFEEIVSLTKNY